MKGWPRSSILSDAMPMPVSLTVSFSILPSRAASIDTTPPASVNLMALPARLMRTWRMARWSAEISPIPRWMRLVNVRPFSFACKPSMASQDEMVSPIGKLSIISS
ncbi:hypothetical protein D3C87_1825160 [compost metagenome]